MTNPFLQVLAAADESKRTHHEREAAATRAHFAQHPECRKIITAMDADGYVTRVKGEIDIEARCQPGWFKESMWKGNYYQAQRPVEVEVEAVQENIWLEIKPGQAVDMHKFMQIYLQALHQPTRASRIRAARPHRDQMLKGIASMI